MANQLSDHRKNAIELARQMLQKKPYYLDTETTGIDKSSEIVEIAVIDDDSNIVFQSLVKPSHQIPEKVTAIHGITNQMVASSPAFPIIWHQLRPLIGNRLIAVYNAEFDINMIKQSFTQYRLPWKDKIDEFCIMKLYAQFRGDWNPQRQQYRYISLDNAGSVSGIKMQNTHRAADDALLARELLHYIAGQI